jgi:hypothetical protein
MAQLADLLGGLGNPAAMRSAILQRLGIDANRVSGLGSNVGFDNSINDLYRQGAETGTALDTQEGNVNRGYQQSIAQQAIDRDRALQAIKGNFANRGMTFSGAMIDENARANSDYDRYVSNLGADRDSALGDIGQRRTNLLEGLSRGRMSAEEGYGGDIAGFLQQQAIDLWNTNYQQALQQQAQGGGGYSAPRPSAPAPSRGYAPASKYVAPAPKPAPVHTSMYTGDYVRPDVAVNKSPVPAKKVLTPRKGPF